MPFLVDQPDLATLRRVHRLPGLPDFNATSAFTIAEFTGLRGRAAPNATLVANGGGRGAVAVGGWSGRERLHTLRGLIQCSSREEMFALERALTGSIPADREVPVQILDPHAEDLQLWVRLYDEPDVTFAGPLIRFTLPLVCPEGLKYGLTSLSAEAGGFTASDWFRTYADDSGFVRSYDVTGARFYQETVEDASALPKVATLGSPGDAVSSRVTFTVTGPLDAGGWWVEDAAGRRLRAEVSLTEGQSVTFDCHNLRAWLNGAPIDHIVYGDYLTLEPGENSYRLVVDESSGAPYMSVEALPAYL